MVTQIARVVNGKPLYSSPTIYYTPWLYEPVYYYVSALIAGIVGVSFQAARIPSVLSTIAILTLIFYIVRRETGKTFYAMAAIGLYLAAYGKVEYSYVMARIDPLFNVLVVAGFIAIYYSKSNSGLIIGALLLALSYFTKQTALVFAPTIIIYLWRIRGWKPALFFGGAFALFIIGGIVILDRIYDGWFTYYTLLVPKGKGKTLRWGYAVDGFFVYVLLRCWLFTTIMAFFSIKAFFSKKMNDTSNAILFFGLFFVTSLAAGFLGILNMGGGHNVLLPTAAGCALFLPIFVNHFSEQRKASPIIFCVIPLQLVLLIANPWRDPRNIAREIDKSNQEEFFREIASLPGEVWVTYHGFTEPYTGKKAYADIVAIKDVLVADDSVSHSLRRQLDSAYMNEHWSYIIADLPDTFPHYSLYRIEKNRNKIQMNDDTMLYIYKPENK